jgi:hypothetical protein
MTQLTYADRTTNVGNRWVPIIQIAAAIGVLPHSYLRRILRLNDARG